MVEPEDMTVRWSGTQWRAEVEDWISDVLAANDVRRTGSTEQPRIRHWSTQLTIPTTIGRLWFKENCPALVFEAALVELLAELVPGRVVRPLAVDRVHGRMLSPDAGATLASLACSDVAAWVRVVQEYGALQRELVGHADRILATGLTARLPGDAAGYLRRQILGLGGDGDQPLTTGADELDYLTLKLLPQIEQAGQTLMAAALPLSLQHNDLHHNNAFVPDVGPLRFFDFGDAVWAHPFSVLKVTCDVIQEEWNAGPTDPRLQRIIDAYLECWTDLAPRTALRELIEPAFLLARLDRYESGRRLIHHLPPSAAPKFVRWVVDQLLS